MSKIVSLAALALLLAGCKEPPPPGYKCWRGFPECSSAQIERILECDNSERAKFIIDCAKAANPMSDEEGEDLILQCEKTSESLFCTEQKVKQPDGL